MNECKRARVDLTFALDCDVAFESHPEEVVQHQAQPAPNFQASPHVQSLPPCAVKDALVYATYQVPVASLPPDFRDAPWFTQLTLQPVTSSVCPQKPKPLVLYREHRGVLYLPRFAALLALGMPRDCRSLGATMSAAVQFTGKLCADNPPQVQATTATLQQLHHLGGALLVLPCGFGKTVCALHVAAVLHRRTLILVHAEALGAQWVERIRMFVPRAVVGKIQQDVVQVEGCDFVVGMIQSVVKRDYPTALLESFGLVIVDEAHHVAAPMFSKALPKLPAKYVLALSATPNRADGCGVALEYLMGPTAFRAQRVHERVSVRVITYTRGAEEELLNRQGKPLCSTMLTNLAGDTVRTALLRDVVVNYYAHGRNIIVLSDRLDQLALLHDMLLTLDPHMSVAKVVGGTKAKDREQGFGARVLLSTYHYASEGIDIPRLDTLLMATPRGNVEQTVGRILRPHPSKQQPLVVDIKDPFSLFTGMAWKRHAYYKQHKYYVSRERDVEGDDESSDA